MAKLQLTRDGKLKSLQVQAERDVTKDVVRLLRLYGWQVFRNQVGTFTPLYFLNQVLGGQISITQAKVKRHTNTVKIGEKGQPDWLAIRMADTAPGVPRGMCRALYLEIKKPGKKPGPDQLVWMQSWNDLGGWSDYCDCGLDAQLGRRADEPKRSLETVLREGERP